MSDYNYSVSFYNNDRLADLEAIRKLRILYSHLLDMNDHAGWSGLFTENAIADVSSFGYVGEESGGQVWQGRAQILRNIETILKIYNKRGVDIYPYLHPTTNHWIEFSGTNTAKGRCYLMDFVISDPNPLKLLAIYDDDYEKENDCWRITSMKIRVVWPEHDFGHGP